MLSDKIYSEAIGRSAFVRSIPRHHRRGHGNIDTARNIRAADGVAEAELVGLPEKRAVYRAIERRPVAKSRDVAHGF
jgi:hypothetical protein